MKRTTTDEAARALSRRRAAIYARRHGEARSDATEVGSALQTSPAGELQSLPEAESNEVMEIDAALKRIEHGRYGWCERCSGGIGTQRLNALPETRYCLSCVSG